MRQFLSLALLLLVACSPVASPPQPPVAPAVSEIGGVLTGETVLSGDYLLVSDLLVPPGGRLLIRPGTTIRVRRAETTKIDPEFLSAQTEILVRGSIQVAGTSDAPVRILPENPASFEDPAWAGLLLDRPDSAVLSHLQLSGAETGVLAIGSDLQLTDTRLEANRYGLVIQGGSPLIERTRIAQGEGGVFIWRGAAPTLKETRIAANAEEGVYVDRSCRPQFHAVRSEGNAIGLVAAARPDVADLQLRDNDTDWRRLLPAAEPVR